MSMDSINDSTNLVTWACGMKNENILKECIDSRYNLNEENVDRCELPLMTAVQVMDNLNIIKLLVNNGADLNHIDYDGECVLDALDEFVEDDKEYFSFFQGIGVEKLKNTNKGMSKLAIEIANNDNCSPTTKEEVNQVDARGLTPFLWAIYYERQNYIDYYIELGADVNKAGKTGITPLMMAFKDYFDLVKKLVESGANVNQLDHNGISAIGCFDDNDFSQMDYLFEKGAKIDPCPNKKGRSPLMIAAIRNDDSHFDYFLNKKANVNFIDFDGNSVLCYAILNKNTKNAEKLIANGANVNAFGPNGKPPLTWSVFVQETNIIQFLLDNGAKINQADHQGRTALYYAEKYQYAQIMELLKENGAKATIISQDPDIFSVIQAQDMDLLRTLLNDFNIYMKNAENETLMDVAVQLGDLDIIKLLLEKEKDLFVHTALPKAIETENIPLVKLLLERGANVNRIYRQTKQSPLLQAINQQNADIVRLLLMFNANIRTSENPSAFQRALQLEQGSIIQMITEKAADVIKQKGGKSFLEKAIVENNIHVIIYLLKNGADPRIAVGRLKELAKESDELDILLENVIMKFNKENCEPKAKKKKKKSK